MGDTTYKVHVDGYDVGPALRGEAVRPRKEVLYWTVDGSVAALRYENWKITFLEQKAEGLKVWQEPFTKLWAPKITNLRMDPFERAEQEHAMGQQRWYLDRMFAIAPAAPPSTGRCRGRRVSVHHPAAASPRTNGGPPCPGGGAFGSWVLGGESFAALGDPPVNTSTPLHPSTPRAMPEPAPQPIPASMPAYSYEAVLRASERVQWDVDDLIGGDRRLDFAMPFMPESFARTAALEFLSPSDRRTLNQIRGHAYLAIFGLVEEFIVPFVMDHVRSRLGEGDTCVRAFLGFASEEAKHINLFRRFRESFERGFGRRCDVIGPPEAVAKQVLSHDALAVALTILHIEWMTQRHFLDSVRDDTGIDPMFKDLLRHHWMEEAQHAKLDTLMVEAIAAGMTREEIMKGVDGYLDIGGFLDAGLRQQTELDMASLERAMGRVMTPSQRERFLAVQHQANRWTYLGSGMTHPNFLDTLGRLAPEARAKLEAVAPAFC